MTSSIADTSVPPGFVSLTSFTLTRTDNGEKSNDHEAGEKGIGSERNQMDAFLRKVDIAALKRSLGFRPWILPGGIGNVSEETVSKSVTVPNQELHVKAQLPRGVNRGCPSCGNCLKVYTTWQPEQSCSPVLESVPVFRPTDEEFKDALSYIASIRLKAESYGMCRIIPPSSWNPPCLLKQKSIWRSSKFTTHVERIDELQNVCLKSEHLDADKVRSNAESCGCAHGLEYTLETFKKYADDFKRLYFKIRKDYRSECTGDEGPSPVNIEGEYWRVIQNPDAEVEVLSAVDGEPNTLGSGFPVETKSEKGLMNNGYDKSHWNLNNIPKLSGSLISMENHGSSVHLVPKLFVGMCFSSHCWNVKDHHLYSLHYSHMGAPSMWYSIPSRYRFKFEEVAKKHFPELLQNPQLFHKLVPQLSPCTLVAEGIPVYRCLQQEREFVVVFPEVYNSGFSCGFNCSESINFAPIDWLPYGQNAVELYSDQCRKTSISYDKVLLRVAMRVVRAHVELLFEKSIPENDKWREASGKDGNLAKALKERIKQESIRRKYLCLPSQSRQMEDNFDACVKRECCICFFDLHLSAAGCPCSPNKYTCLRHAKKICSCTWDTKYFLFRFEIKQLNKLLDALEGNTQAAYAWAKEKIGLTTPSPSQSESTPGVVGTSHVASQLVKDPVSVPDSNPGKLDTDALDNSSVQTSKKRPNPNADDSSKKLPRNQPVVIDLSDGEDE